MIKNSLFIFLLAMGCFSLAAQDTIPSAEFKEATVWKINSLGYEYLKSFREPLLAEAILRANALFFPQSPNAHDSYGEALAENGKLKASVASYQKAVEVAKANNDPGVGFYQENLEKVKARME